MPRAQAEQASAGTLEAGLVPVAEWFRLQDRFERLGPFGIAVRGRAQSTLLFSRVPLHQLDGRLIGLTTESVTTVALLRLLLTTRYGIQATFVPGKHPEAEAILLIGDEALRFRQANRAYPYETDVAFEWWMWQHLPFVFAVWVVRKDLDPTLKKALERAVSGTLGANLSRLTALAAARAPGFGMTTEAAEEFLRGFTYRLSRSEEDGIVRFKELLHGAHLL